MTSQELTRPRLARALEALRTSKGLTLQQVAERATRFRGQALLESQVADFEHGTATPSSETLLSLLAACSDDRATVDLAPLQRVFFDTAEESADDWLVEPAEDGFAVRSTKGISAVFSDLRRACLAAAILPHANRDLRFRLVCRDDTGFDVILGSVRTVGWLREYSPETIEALHVIEGIVDSPVSLALLLEAAQGKTQEREVRAETSMARGGARC